MNGHVVIIGASHAAAEAITTLRRKGWEGEITLIGDEPSLPYHRPPLSKGYYKGDVVEEKLLIKGESVYQKAKVNLRLGTRAISIDRDRKSVTLEDGQTVSYTKLILATGTKARELPVTGADLPSVFTLRTKADVESIKSALPVAGHLLIVGAGYIGLEVAASAIQCGLKVTVLEAADRVLSRVTSEPISGFFTRMHANAGVTFHFNCSLTKFEQREDKLVSILADGTELDCDCALVGIGVEPNIELAVNAGLPCDNGVVVDEYTKTADADIFAVGDCSSHPNKFYNKNIRLESVPNASDQAKTAALCICDQAVPYQEIPWFWSDQYDCKLQTVGLLTGFDDYVLRGSPDSGKFAVFYFKEEQLIAMDAINSPGEFMVCRRLIPLGISPSKDELSDVSYSLKSLL